MKYKESDTTGNELHYAQFPGIQLYPLGVWTEDYKTMSSKEYREWFYSVHPKPVDVRQATRYWLDRRKMLWRRQHPTPGSYEEFLQIKRWIGPGTKYEDGYDYIAHQEDTEDGGSLYRMHMIRQRAAIDLQHSVEDDAYITEQQIDNFLIANHEPEEGEEERTEAMRQKMKATRKMIIESYAKRYAKDGFTYVPPPPRTTVPVYTPEKRDWDFFYRSLQAPPDIRLTILAKMCSGTKPEFKSELRTQRASVRNNTQCRPPYGSSATLMPSSTLELK
jgi:hypothetical protein